MKDICLQGYNSRYITMLCDGEAAPGDLVVMSANNTVKKATSGKFMGVIHSMRGEYALIQTGGFTVLHYSGEDPTVGFVGLMADSNADGGQRRRRQRGAGDRGRHCCKKCGYLILRKTGGFYYEVQLSEHFYFEGFL